MTGCKIIKQDDYTIVFSVPGQTFGTNHAYQKAFFLVCKIDYKKTLDDGRLEYGLTHVIHFAKRRVK